MARYSGNLVEKGPPERNVAVYSFSSDDGREAAKVRLVAYAEKTMASAGIASATLVMTENDIVIGVRYLAIGKL
jgi:uncharacterized ferredoxin-like protein